MIEYGNVASLLDFGFTIVLLDFLHRYGTARHILSRFAAGFVDVRFFFFNIKANNSHRATVGVVVVVFVVVVFIVALVVAYFVLAHQIYFFFLSIVLKQLKPST